MTGDIGGSPFSARTTSQTVLRCNSACASHRVERPPPTGPTSRGLPRRELRDPVLRMYPCDNFLFAAFCDQTIGVAKSRPDAIFAA